MVLEKKDTTLVLPGLKLGPLGPSRKKYFGVSQLSVRWGVSAPTVVRLIEEGQLTGLKIRGVYRVSRDSIESYERKVAF